MLSKKDILKGLRELGIKNGISVLVHGSYRSLGGVRGGPEVVIDALLEALGTRGTLLMPAFNYLYSGHFRLNLPSKMGILTELFKKRKGVLRGFHPTHSVCAYGRNAKWLIKDHVKAPTACGKDTPFGRLCEIKGKIFLLGVDQDRNTTLHTVETYANLPYLSEKKISYVDEKGKVRKIVLKRHPGPHRNFIGIDRLLRENKIMKVAKIGRAVCRLIDAKHMVEFLTGEVRKNTELFLCDNLSCGDCLKQKGMIKAHRLKEENFKLAISIPFKEISKENFIKYRDTQAITHIELDFENDVVARPDLKKIANLIGKVPGINIASVNVGKRLNLLPAVKDILKPDWIVVSGSKIPDCKNVLLENTKETSCKLVKRILAKDDGLQLAFNPQNFAKVGEKPFLDVYLKTKLKKYIGLLYFVDGTFKGNFSYPIEGNGELKELLSILRCRSFNGYVVIKSASKGIALDGCVLRFWRALDEI